MGAAGLAKQTHTHTQHTHHTPHNTHTHNTHTKTHTTHTQHTHAVRARNFSADATSFVITYPVDSSPANRAAAAAWEAEFLKLAAGRLSDMAAAANLTLAFSAERCVVWARARAHTHTHTHYTHTHTHTHKFTQQTHTGPSKTSSSASHTPTRP